MILGSDFYNSSFCNIDLCLLGENMGDVLPKFYIEGVISGRELSHFHESILVNDISLAPPEALFFCFFNCVAGSDQNGNSLVASRNWDVWEFLKSISTI